MHIWMMKDKDEKQMIEVCMLPTFSRIFERLPPTTDRITVPKARLRERTAGCSGGGDLPPAERLPAPGVVLGIGRRSRRPAEQGGLPRSRQLKRLGVENASKRMR
jgi:hypothetical protein